MSKEEYLLSLLIVSPTINGTYKLKESLRYRGDVIPKGYETNGGNIPMAFRSFILPFAPRLLFAFTVHDYYCDRKEYRKADKLFYLALKDLSVRKWKRVLLYKSVRTYHKIKYNT